MSSHSGPSADREAFSSYLESSTNILALLGAGLSASSGLPTFRGAGGLWRSHDAMSLATPEAFNRNPSLVWQFYSYRRHMALGAQPNPAHYALAELARRKERFITLTQNVDGLSQRAGHPARRAGHPTNKLHLLHGSLFDVRCTSFYCDYVGQDFEDPIVPALAIPREKGELKPSDSDRTGEEATTSFYHTLDNKISVGKDSKELDISDDRIEIPELQVKDLPQCPKCGGLLRPGVVWFGEVLPEKTIDAIDEFMRSCKTIDLILVIGTSSKVYPAAGYVDQARAKGARVAVINMNRADLPGGRNGLSSRDWFFEGDAGVIVPDILKSVTGNVASTNRSEM